MNKRNIFYYDESFHTRKITKGYMDENCDSYVGASVGWNASKDEKIREYYQAFEDRYKTFYGVDELKSQIIKKKFYEYGIASFKKDQLNFYIDYFSILEKGIFIYVCVLSKMETVIRQLIYPYYGYDTQMCQSIVYILTKAIWTYRPDNVINALFTESDKFMLELKTFLKMKVREIRGLDHKELELNAFQQCLQILNDNLNFTINFDWNYDIAFYGLKLLTKELHLNQNRLSLILDNEGKAEIESKTLRGAKNVGFHQAIEVDSTMEMGVRIADLLCGFVGRIIRAMEESYSYKNDEFKQTKLIDCKWFKLSEEQFGLYKKQQIYSLG